MCHRHNLAEHSVNVVIQIIQVRLDAILEVSFEEDLPVLLGAINPERFHSSLCDYRRRHMVPTSPWWFQARFLSQPAGAPTPARQPKGHNRHLGEQSCDEHLRELAEPRFIINEDDPGRGRRLECPPAVSC